MRAGRETPAAVAESFNPTQPEGLANIIGSAALVFGPRPTSPVRVTRVRGGAVLDVRTPGAPRVRGFKTPGGKGIILRTGREAAVPGSPNVPAPVNTLPITGRGGLLNPPTGASSTIPGLAAGSAVAEPPSAASLRVREQKAAVRKAASEQLVREIQRGEIPMTPAVRASIRKEVRKSIIAKDSINPLNRDPAGPFAKTLPPVEPAKVGQVRISERVRDQIRKEAEEGQRSLADVPASVRKSIRSGFTDSLGARPPAGPFARELPLNEPRSLFRLRAREQLRDQVYREVRSGERPLYSARKDVRQRIRRDIRDEALTQDMIRSVPPRKAEYFDPRRLPGRTIQKIGPSAVKIKNLVTGEEVVVRKGKIPQAQPPKPKTPQRRRNLYFRDRPPESESGPGQVLLLKKPKTQAKAKQQTRATSMQQSAAAERNSATFLSKAESAGIMSKSAKAQEAARAARGGQKQQARAKAKQKQGRKQAGILGITTESSALQAQSPAQSVTPKPAQQPASATKAATETIIDVASLSIAGQIISQIPAQSQVPGLSNLTSLALTGATAAVASRQIARTAQLFGRTSDDQQRSPFGSLGAQRVQGYVGEVKRTQAKRGGKRVSRGYAKAHEKPLPYNDAWNRAALAVDSYANRSFRVKRANVRVPPTNTQINQALAAKMRTSKRNPSLFVEKTAHAIDSPGERRQIPFEAARQRRSGAPRRSGGIKWF